MPKALTPKPLPISNRNISQAIESYGSDDAVIAAALAILGKRITQPTDMQQLDNPQDVKNYLTLTLGALDYEVYWAVYLGPWNQVLAAEEVARGDADQVLGSPKAILKRALELNASAVITAHNHPGSVAEPSKADMDATFELAKVLGTLHVQLIDSFVVAGNQIGSLGAAMQKHALKEVGERVPAEVRDALVRLINEHLRPGRIDAAVQEEAQEQLEQHAESTGKTKH